LAFVAGCTTVLAVARKEMSSARYEKYETLIVAGY
jgi:hypothetical protein